MASSDFVHKVLWVFLCFMLGSSSGCYAQVSHSRFINIVSEEYRGSIYMDGYLDGKNSYSRLSKFDRWENNYTQFLPMKSIVVHNRGQTNIIAPRLIINNERNWYSDNGVLLEAIGPKQTKLDKSAQLRLWTFLKSNREHYYPSGFDGMDAYNMLTTYGYTMCDIVAYVGRQIVSNNGGKAYSYLMPHHTILEVDAEEFGDVIIDPDLECFYLMPDNKTLAGVKNVLADKYLIWRTKHLGPNILYDKAEDTWISTIYNGGYYAPSRLTKSSSLEMCDFLLRPHEAIEFCYDSAKRSYHFWSPSIDVPNSFRKYFISNSKHSLSLNFETTTLEDVFEDVSSMGVELSTITNRKMLWGSLPEASSVYSVNLPFPIVDATLKGVFWCEAQGDSIGIFLATDSEEAWEKLAVLRGSGLFEDSVHIGSKFRYPLPSSQERPIRGYKLKLVLYSATPSKTCGIDSLNICSNFQISKRFLPELRIGNNTIEYTDASGNDPSRNVEVAIEWVENWSNHPPNKVTAPVFPPNQSSVDSLYFAFTWNPATDDDGDEIVDYEFMLSDDSRMLYPHSPNFNLYVSAFNEGIRPYFKVKETGWLNHGTTYYWRVRAKDANGTWGEWSDTWSFTPQGVMRPVNGRSEIKEQVVNLYWDDNPIGFKPDFYKVYASNETNGFFPDTSTFFTIVDTAALAIPFKEDEAPYSFYRVSACSSLGQESLISDVIEIPYPYVYSKPDSIRQNTPFKFKLNPNERYYLYYFYEYLIDHYIPSVTIDQRPDWLSYADGVLSSNDVAIARKLVFMDSTARIVKVSLDDGYGGVAHQVIELQTAETNRMPQLELSVECSGLLYKAYITSTDGDILHGDTHFFNVLEKPDWVTYNIVGDTIHLKGIPTKRDLNKKHFIKVAAVDSKGATALFEFPIEITPNLLAINEPDLQVEEDHLWEYSLFACKVPELGVELKLSIEHLPEWIQVDGRYRFTGIPRINNLNDTILHFLIADRACNVSIEKELHIAIEHVNHAPEFTHTPLPLAHDSGYYEAQLKAADIDSVIEEQNIRFHLVSPTETWIELDTIAGFIRGLPDRSKFKDEVLVFSACDRYNFCTYDTVFMHIFGSPQLELGVSCKGAFYQSYITSKDGDVLYGDTNFYDVLSKPSWIDYQISGDSIFFKGVPLKSDLSEQVPILVRATDTHHNITTYEFPVDISANLVVLNDPVLRIVDNQPWEYVLLSKQDPGWLKNVELSLQSMPRWLNVDSKFRFWGTPRIGDYPASTVYFSLYDRKCGTKLERELYLYMDFEDQSPQFSCQILLPEEGAGVHVAKVAVRKSLSFQYYIVSLSGKVVYISSVIELSDEGVHSFQLDMQRYPKGVYIFLGRDSKGGRQSVKFIN